MGIIKSQAIRSTAFIYVGVVLGFITQGILAPNFLKENEIGALNLIASYSGIFAALAALGFTNVTVKYFPYFRNEKKGHHGFLLLSIIVGTLGFLMFLGIYYLIKPIIVESNIEKSPLFAKYFFLVVPLTLFQIYFMLFDSYNNMLYRSTIGVIHREFVQRILILLALIALILDFYGFGNYAYLYTFSICLPTLLMIYHLVLKKDFNLKPDWRLLNKNMIKGMAGLSIFGLLNSINNFAILRIDAIMVNYFINDSATGIYVTTFYFGALVVMPARALSRIAPTLMADAFKKNKLDIVFDIYKKSAINQWIIALLIYLGLVLNLENIFHIIPDKFAAGRYVIILIGLVNVVKMGAGLDWALIIYSKYYKYSTAFLTFWLACLILFNALLIPTLGLTGAALASLISLLILNAMKLLFIYKKFHIQPYNYRFIVVLIIAVVLYLTISLIPPLNHFIFDIILRSSIAIAIFTTIVYYLKISPDLNAVAKSAVIKTVGWLKKK